MKINSNTVQLETEHHQAVETIIKKIASENKIENVESVSITLDPKQGMVQFKSINKDERGQ